MKILMVVTSNAALGDTGRWTGLWLEEFASPYYLFKKAAAEVTVASPLGGPAPIDPLSQLDPARTKATERLETDPEGRAALVNTHRLRDLSPRDFDGLFYPGGHGLLWDLADDPSSVDLIEQTLAESKPAAFVSHAPAALRHVLTAEGQSLVRGRDVTAISNREEDLTGLSGVVPYLVEDALRQRGARYDGEEIGKPHIVLDEELITGQNTASAGPAARALVEKLHFFSLAGAVRTIPWAIP